MQGRLIPLTFIASMTSSIATCPTKSEKLIRIETYLCILHEWVIEKRNNPVTITDSGLCKK